MGRRSTGALGVLALALLLGPGGCRPGASGERGVPGMDLAGGPLAELELRGRQVFVRERCVSCHVPGAPSTVPFRGSGRTPGRRVGPTLSDVGGRFTDAWHYAFLDDPRSLIATSTMPAYPWLVKEDGEPTEDGRALVAWLQAQRDPKRAWDPGQAIAESRKAPAQAAAGAQVYRRNCAGCHGESGTPPEPVRERFDPPPSDLRATEYALVPRDAEGLLDRERLLTLVVRGVGRTDMPGHAYLPPTDLSSLVEHVRELGGRGVADAPLPERPAEPAPEAKRLGAGVWLALGCDVCHGPEGRGDGPLAPETLFDLTEGALKGGRDADHLAWVAWRGLPGTPMPGFAFALEGLGPDALSARLATTPEGEGRRALEHLLARLPHEDSGSLLGALVAFVMAITDPDAALESLEGPGPPPGGDVPTSRAARVR